MSFEYFEPETVAQAAELADRYRGSASFLAGGTDLVIQMQRKIRQPRQIIDIQRLGALRAIAKKADRLSLGALTTHKDIERFPGFRTALRGLIESAEVIGGHQVRNVATVGGNICNASPAADLLPILLALDAEVHLSGVRTSRQLALSAFLQGPGRTARGSDEVLTAVTFAAPGPRTATAFIKIGRRRAMEISVASVAALIALDPDGRCTDARIAVGAVAPTAIRLPEPERLLRGERLSPDLLADVGRKAEEAAAPLSDVRASAEFRRHLVKVIVPRAIQRCMERVAEKNQ